MFYFDSNGWWSKTPIAGREISVDPTFSAAYDAPQDGWFWPNWTGTDWIVVPYVTPSIPAAPPTPEAVYQWFIDIGPFLDRFGSSKILILSSTNATVKAIITDLQVRKWVDLKRADVLTALQAIAALIPGSLTQEQITSILSTPVGEFENMALRKTYFS